jgi:thymidylate synthase (FAD)
MSAKLVAISKPSIPGIETAEDLIAYVARVSNPSNQTNVATSAGLVKYCIRHKHWSVFQTVSMTIEISTTRAIAAQILRHRSFTFQEFSQRYAALQEEPEPQEARRQDLANRQNSFDDMSEEIKKWWYDEQTKLYESGMELYVNALERGIAKECARFVLPLSSPTKLYMTGSVRDFIHYIELRSSNETQKEHRDVAESCKKIFADQFPSIAKALDW